MFDKQNDSGVSPVIGVILMVAVTVALVALVTVTVFDLGGDVSESPDATVQLEEADNQVQATLLRNENVDYLYLSGDGVTDSSSLTLDTSSDDTMANAGDTITTGSTGNYSSGGLGSGNSGTVNVIAVLPDGSEEVLTSTDYDFTA